MYYPIQIPYILSDAFLQHMSYAEEPADVCGGFGLCFWEMRPRSALRISLDNIIVADGCIDVVVNYEDKSIGFSGTSRTDFHFKIDMPVHYCGARMMPGAFHQLTGLPASEAMDTFLPMDAVFNDFDRIQFFRQSFEEVQSTLKAYLLRITQDMQPDTMTSLFHRLTKLPLASAKDLYELLHFSPRQCQRLFARHYGLTPKMALSIVRFQQCLALLASPHACPADVCSVDSYYDQPHFIKDFKQHLGITPLELIRHYQT